MPIIKHALLDYVVEQKQVNNFEIGQVPLAQFSWHHNITLLQKCPNEKNAFGKFMFYQSATGCCTNYTLWLVDNESK